MNNIKVILTIVNIDYKIISNNFIYNLIDIIVEL